jgi:hypothetical protein
MPRKSSAAISTLPAINVRSIRLEPRPDAPLPIKDLFRETTMALRPEHFRPCDQNLLELFCQAVLLSREAYRELELADAVSPDGRMSAWTTVLEKSHRIN